MTFLIRFIRTTLVGSWLMITGITGIYAQGRTDFRLTHKIDSLVKGFPGTVGIYIKNLKSGETAVFQPDSIFPTCSMIKVPIMITLFNRIEHGALSYQQNMVYRDSMLIKGVDILGGFKDSATILLSKLVLLMITESDNTAAVWCQSLAGGGIAINHWLKSHGFVHTRVNSRTPGRSAAWNLYGWGQTTPREMARLVTLIREGKLVSPAASERMYRNLIRIYWDGEALSQIPPYVQVASKQGAVDDSRSEVDLVNAPHGDYVFCIITKNLQDTSWKQDNEGWTLIRRLSGMLYHYYEPQDNWKPAPGREKWIDQ
ncbi:MAG TPA: serine hydrolase [Chitinophagaceae bacterium]|nr:serine hydrolase [Chitinophagaceae bacterium]